VGLWIEQSVVVGGGSEGRSRFIREKAFVVGGGSERRCRFDFETVFLTWERYALCFQRRGAACLFIYCIAAVSFLACIQTIKIGVTRNHETASRVTRINRSF